MILRAAAAAARGRQKSLLLTRGAATTPFNLKKKPVSLLKSNDLPVNQRPTLFHVKGGLTDSQVALFNKAIVELKLASNVKDAHTAIRIWQHLEQNSLLHFLPQPQTDAVSGILANIFTSGAFVSYNMAILEGIALQAATQRSTDALNALMVVYLQQNNPSAVVRLYQIFMELLGEKEVWEDPQNVEDKGLPSAHHGSHDPSKINRLPYIPGRVELLLAVTAAHADQNTFQDALRTCLQTVVRFHSHSTKLFLQKLRHNPALQAKLSLYVKRLDIARLVARPPSLSKHIMDLSSAPSTKLLDDLYQAILAGLTGPDAFLAVNPSKITSTKSVAMTETSWTSFLTAFLKRRRLDLAEKMWADMSDLQYKPGVSLWTAVIDSYDSIGAVEEALGAWNMMIAQGIKPESLSYRALLSSLFNGRKVDEAMHYFQAFQKLPPKESSPSHTLSVYNTMLRGLLVCHQENEAYALLQTMESKGPVPDLISYNTFLAHQGRRRNFKALADLVGRMAALGLVGDVFTFSTILSALLKAGREDAPELIINIMRKQGVEPNVATYSAIIDHQMQERTEQNLVAVMHMLQWMERVPNTMPNSITYTSILAGLCRGGWLASEKVDEYIKDIVERMRKRGVELNMVGYHILLGACLEDPGPQGLTRALGYYQEMRRRKYVLTHTTWYILLLGLLRRRDWGVAEELIHDMYVTGHNPTGTVRDLIGKIRRRAGA